MFCTQCGKQGPEAGVYCAFCGAKMLAPEAGLRRRAAKAASRPAWSGVAKSAFVVVSVVLCAAVVVDLAVRWSGGKHDREQHSGFWDGNQGIAQDIWQETGVEPRQVIPVADEAIGVFGFLVWLPALIVFVGSLRVWDHKAKGAGAGPGPATTRQRGVE